MYQQLGDGTVFFYQHVNFDFFYYLVVIGFGVGKH